VRQYLGSLGGLGPSHLLGEGHGDAGDDRHAARSNMEVSEANAQGLHVCDLAQSKGRHTEGMHPARVKDTHQDAYTQTHKHTNTHTHTYTHIRHTTGAHTVQITVHMCTRHATWGELSN
jgi:hypothetical protein